MHFFSRKKHAAQARKAVQTPAVSVIAGRRHRTDVPYILPKDGQEVKRLDYQHYALRHFVGGDYAAPIDTQKVTSILDSGCGTGRWVVEMANICPRARIFGMDIEPPSPFSPPKRCIFQKGNVLEGIQFPDQSFDFVHQRLLVGAIPAKQWPGVVKELVRVTRSGGYVELLESGDLYINPGPATQQFQAWWRQGSQQAGFDVSRMPQLGTLLQQTGLNGVTMRKLQIPLGRWGGREGEMMGRDIHEVFKSFKGFYTSRLEVDAKQFDKVATALPREWEKYHTSYEFYLVYGQR